MALTNLNDEIFQVNPVFEWYSQKVGCQVLTHVKNTHKSKMLSENPLVWSFNLQECLLQYLISLCLCAIPSPFFAVGRAPPT